MEDAKYDDDDDELPAIAIDCSSMCAVSTDVESACTQSGEEPGTEHKFGNSMWKSIAGASQTEIGESVEIREPLAPGFLVLLKGLHDQLPFTLRGFLSKYLDDSKAGQNNDHPKVLYQQVMSDIISVVACPSNNLSETSVTSASAWLLCACATIRVGVNAMQALQYLLNEKATAEQMLELCVCVQRCGWEAAQLLRASAAARGLAGAVLLRAAAAAALAAQVRHAAPASVEEVTDWMTAETSREGDKWQVTAVQVAGRLLAHCAATEQQREALVAAFTRKCRARGPDAHKVALAVSRLKVILRH